MVNKNKTGLQLFPIYDSNLNYSHVDDLLLVSFSDIKWIVSDTMHNGFCKFKIAGHKFKASTAHYPISIEQLIAHLPDCFIRISSCEIVNLNAIDKIGHNFISIAQKQFLINKIYRSTVKTALQNKYLVF